MKKLGNKFLSGLTAVFIFVFIEFIEMTVQCANEEAILKKQLIYSLDEKPTPQCHSSTIVQTRSGKIFAAWFGGTREGSKDVCIWLARYEDERWTKPIKVADGVQYITADGKEFRYPCWNPVLFQPSKGPLLLFYKVGPSPDLWWGMLMTSGDDGITWSAPVRLPEGIIGAVKNKPVELADGTILCGSSTEDKGWRVHFELTRDFGKRWIRTADINNPQKLSAIQPAILKHPSGKLQALGRSRQGRIWESWSLDGGMNWTEPALLDLPNPNSGIDAITLKNGLHVLVYNKTPKGRTPLNVAISKDGRGWQDVLVLENEVGEFSYPAVIQSSDGLLHITYTWKRISIMHTVVDIQKIK
ncbi:MAG: sialidase family protein [Verrucomicrobiia bacterium]|jgi:predicted neuraminidase